MGSFCRFPGDLPEKPRKVSFTEYLRTMKLGGKACTLRGECKFQPVLFNSWYLCLVHSTQQFQRWRKSQDVVFKIIKAMSNVLPDTSARRNTFLKLRVKSVPTAMSQYTLGTKTRIVWSVCLLTIYKHSQKGISQIKVKERNCCF